MKHKLQVTCIDYWGTLNIDFDLKFYKPPLLSLKTESCDTLWWKLQINNQFSQMTADMFQKIENNSQVDIAD